MVTVSLLLPREHGRLPSFFAGDNFKSIMIKGNTRFEVYGEDWDLPINKFVNTILDLPSLVTLSIFVYIYFQL